jgi:hypothetical protein
LKISVCFTELLTSGLLKGIIRTTTTVSANPAIKEDKQLPNESAGYDFILLKF